MVSHPPMIGQSPPTPEATQEPQVTVLPANPVGVVEIGGRDGPDPTRYGDWEKNGRCIDF